MLVCNYSYDTYTFPRLNIIFNARSCVDITDQQWQDVQADELFDMIDPKYLVAGLTEIPVELSDIAKNEPTVSGTRLAAALRNGGGGDPVTAGQGISVVSNQVSARVDGTTIQFDQTGALTAVGGSPTPQRDFTQNPINLVTESTGTLPANRTDPTIARAADVLDKVTYGGTADGVVKQADAVTGVDINQLNSAINNAHTHPNANALNAVSNAGDGSKYLADDGAYKDVPLNDNALDKPTYKGSADGIVKQADEITNVDKAELADAIGKKHEHANKGYLDTLEEPSDALSIASVAPFLYTAVFDHIPTFAPLDVEVGGGCSTFLKDGKVYRNFDYNYDNTATVFVKTPYFSGVGYVNGLLNGDSKHWSKEKINQLPNRIVDGLSIHGIFVSTHLVFNDFSFVGAQGDDAISVVNIPTQILVSCTSMTAVEQWVNNNKGKFSLPASLSAIENTVMFFITDGATTKVLQPTAGGTYELKDISALPVPKLTNFVSLATETVQRSDGNLQTRPTGIERYNAIGTASLQALKWTDCYTTQNRLSEFIGIDNTTKASDDSALLPIQQRAAQAYQTRTRDGTTWQTMHAITYGLVDKSIIISVQEDFNHVYSLVGGAGDIGALEERVSALEPKAHTHDNKALLDTLVADGAGDKYLADDGTYKAEPKLEIGDVLMRDGSFVKSDDASATIVDGMLGIYVSTVNGRKLVLRPQIETTTLQNFHLGLFAENGKAHDTRDFFPENLYPMTLINEDAGVGVPPFSLDWVNFVQQFLLDKYGESDNRYTGFAASTLVTKQEQLRKQDDVNWVLPTARMLVEILPNRDKINSTVTKLGLASILTPLFTATQCCSTFQGDDGNDSWAHYAMRLRIGGNGMAGDAPTKLYDRFSKYNNANGLIPDSGAGSTYIEYNTSPGFNNQPFVFMALLDSDTNLDKPKKADIGITFLTEETDTGNQWIDGKHIYRKVITGSAIQPPVTEVEIGITGTVDTVVELRGAIYSTRNSSWGVIPASNPYNYSDFNLSVYYDIRTNALLFRQSDEGMWVAGDKWHIIMEYTKI